MITSDNGASAPVVNPPPLPKRRRGPARPKPVNLQDLHYWDNVSVQLARAAGNCRSVLLCAAGQCRVVATVCPGGGAGTAPPPNGEAGATRLP